MSYEFDKAYESATRAQRIQNLQAMERLVINLGGRKGFIRWLEAMPDSVEFNAAGGMTHQAVSEIADDNYKYAEMMNIFAEVMQPVLASL